MVCAELERLLNREAGAIAEKPRSAKGQFRPSARGTARKQAPQGASGPGTMDLLPTFGYVASLDKGAAFSRYDVRDEVCERVGGFRHGQVVCDGDGNEFIVVGVKVFKGRARLWFQPTDLGRPAAGAFCSGSAADLRERLVPVAGSTRAAPALQEALLEEFDAAEESDGEEVLLCPQCRLPVGDFWYQDEKVEDGAKMHGECMAQLMAQNARSAHEKCQKKDAALKKSRRAEFGIGWSAEMIPRSVSLAAKLDCLPATKGMCCLAFDTDQKRVRVAQTTEPAASVNLEYLSIALQVRAQAGREPLFSLDPVGTVDPKDRHAMQVKRFEPDWLAKTSVGEVLFQADYHLKELSMGEYEQPVVGMRSGADFAAANGWSKEWNAREWFVVRHADVQMSQDDVLIPSVKMGVEARCQVDVCGALVDALVTRPDHPMVKYAEEFSHRFDLIAERRSVIYHLRELAKTTVLAKFLLTSEVDLEQDWFILTEEAQREDFSLQVPQLWNERSYQRIHVQGREIVDAEAGKTNEGRTYGVYGGVDMSLPKYPVGFSADLSGAVEIAKLSTRVRLMTGKFPVTTETAMMRLKGPSMAETLAAEVAKKEAEDEAREKAWKATRAALAPARPAARPAAPPRRARAPRAAPAAGERYMPEPMVARRAPRAAASVEARGVDLNLDQFDLSAPREAEDEGVPGSWGRLLKTGAPAGDAFWSSLADGAGSELDSEDASLLRDLFNPHMSDRRKEGDLFVPPNTSILYTDRLCDLLDEEEDARQERRTRFLSEDFSASDPGPLFPSSWTVAFDVSRTVTAAPNADAACGADRRLRARPDRRSKAAELDLSSVVPVFDKIAEDGARFRIYKCGGLEVRTIQEHDGEEVIGEVFSHSLPGGQHSQAIPGQEKITKVTEYVQPAGAESGLWSSYVVFETERGNVITAEALADGTAKWEENPDGAEDRNSLAKIVRLVDSIVVQVSDVKGRLDARPARGGSHSECKRYAQAAFNLACGRDPLTSGFCKEFDEGEVQQGTAAEKDKAGAKTKDCRRRQLDKYCKFMASKKQTM